MCFDGSVRTAIKTGNPRSCNGAVSDQVGTNTGELSIPEHRVARDLKRPHGAIGRGLLPYRQRFPPSRNLGASRHELGADAVDQAKVIRKPRLLSDNASSYISGDLVDWLEEHLSSRTRFIPAASPRVWPLICGVSSCRVFGISCGAQAFGFDSPVLAFPLLHDPLPGPCRGSHRPPSRQPPKFRNRAFAALKVTMPIVDGSES